MEKALTAKIIESQKPEYTYFLLGDLPKWTECRMKKDEKWRSRVYILIIFFNLHNMKEEHHSSIHQHRIFDSYSLVENFYFNNFLHIIINENFGKF